MHWQVLYGDGTVCEMCRSSPALPAITTMTSEPTDSISKFVAPAPPDGKKTSEYTSEILVPFGIIPIGHREDMKMALPYAGTCICLFL